MTSLSLNVLGQFQAHLDDQPLPGFRTSKVQALLVYLAIEPASHRRETLMELLWPGMPERSARHNLRQVLYYLRSAIPELGSVAEQDNGDSQVPLLLANRQAIQLNPTAAVSVDAAHMVSLIDGIQTHDHLDLLICPTCRKALEEAVATYKGDFLTGFYLDDSNEFEDWAQINREAYRRKVLDALEVLTTITLRQKEYAQSRELAERQLEIDNLRESSYRQLMEVLALSGRREEALALFESCRRLLAEELGMQPAKRTTEMYEKIIAGDLSFDARPGQGVRGYELKEEIGEGSFGTIHRAVQPTIGREVAVKVIRRKYANRPEFIRRFEDEAQIVARLEHPYVVPLYDYWRDPDGAYLVMRYLKGGNLLSALEDGPWGLEPTSQLLDQIASALSAAHQMGIVHRDIKPSNILLDESGNAYLSDFGIAKNLEADRQLTAAGAILGSPDYMSPEQLLDEKVGPKSDLYSLGAVIFETLTGEKPYGDSSVANLIYKQIHEPFPLLSDSRPDLPPAVDELLQKATAKRAADRYATALEMAADFRLAVQGDRGGRSELMPVPAAILTGVELYNPYKGLQAFQETDADDFFGRETLVERLVARMTPLSASGGKPGVASKGRFLALVGPSGSGKSSVVKAGLIPALRSGAIPGSENWFVAEMVPGTHPLEELEMALWPIAVDAPPSLVEPMQRDVRGMLRTLRRILPLEDSHEEGAQLLLFIDQFEELFTLVEDSERRNFFLDSLLAAIHAPRSPLRVVITLRADFYDRPLHYHLLGELLKENSEIVLPLIPEEIAWAVREPARRVGVGLEERLAEIIVADVAEEPGGLPLLQYALTELFERRQKGLMTRSAYEQIGGVLGALGRRAEEIYGGLSDWGKEATRQMFLRLVTLGEGSEDTRRRILRSELEGVVAPKRDGAPATNQGDNENGRMSPTEIKSQKSDSEEISVLDLFGSARLLTFDRDPASRAPTVEVAHEALLREWRRLRHWLEQSRDEVRLHRLLGTASVEWSKAGKDDSYLLRGTRLAQFEEWSRDSSLALAQGETEFLSRSIDAREGRRSAEEARRQRELEAARKLADTEKARAEIESRRAEEQANAASRLRQRALMLGGVLIIAVGLAVAAAILGQDARRNADLAATREAEAVANAELAAEAAEAEATAAAEALQQKVVAEQERSKAEAQTLVAESRELAAASTSSLATDPELALLLAVEAVDKEDTRAANQALHLALVGSRVRQRLVGHEAAVQRLAYSPDGSLIALAAHGEELATIWDADSGQKLHEIALGRVWGVYFDEDGGQFAAVERSQSFSLGIWDTATGEKRESFPLPFAAREVVGYYLHPDWTRAALYFADGTLAIWNIRGGEQLFELPGHTSSDYVELEFSRDGSRLVSYDWPNGAVMVWDAGSGELIRQIDTGEEVNDHAVSPDGSRVALAVFKDFQGWEVQIWDVDATPADEELSAAVTLTGHAQTIRLIDFSRDGKLVASASRDGTSRIWDSETGESLLVLPHTEHVRSVVFHPDGHRLLSSDIEGVALVWDITPQGSSERLGLVAHDARMYAIDLSPDGGKLATGDDLGGLKIWDLAVQEMSQQMAGHRGSIHDIDFHPDGRRVATASADGTARVWNLANGEELFNLDGHGEGAGSGALPGVLGLDHSPDGTMIATAGNDGTVRIWDSESGQEMRVLQRSDVPLTRVAFSPDGRYLAVGHHSGAQLDMEVKETPVSIWDVETSQELFSFETSHGSGLWGLAFSPDGRFLATSGSDRMARLWRLDYGANDAELLATLSGHSGTIGVVRFSPDGRTLTTANREESRLWDLGALYDSGVGSSEMSVPELLTLPGGYGLFNDDGSELITGGVDGIVRAYLLNLEELMALARSRLTRTLSEAECRQFLHVASCTIEPAG